MEGGRQVPLLCSVLFHWCSAAFCRSWVELHLSIQCAVKCNGMWERSSCAVMVAYYIIPYCSLFREILHHILSFNTMPPCAAQGSSDGCIPSKLFTVRQTIEGHLVLSMCASLFRTVCFLWYLSFHLILLLSSSLLTVMFFVSISSIDVYRVGFQAPTQD